MGERKRGGGGKARSTCAASAAAARRVRRRRPRRSARRARRAQQATLRLTAVGEVKAAASGDESPVARRARQRCEGEGGAGSEGTALGAGSGCCTPGDTTAARRALRPQSEHLDMDTPAAQESSHRPAAMGRLVIGVRRGGAAGRRSYCDGGWRPSGHANVDDASTFTPAGSECLPACGPNRCLPSSLHGDVESGPNH